MARTVLEVVVAGDSRSLERAMGRSSKSVDKFGKDADKGLKKASKGFSGISSAAKLAGGAIAGAGVAAGLKGIADAALESEKSTVKMRAQLKASGVSFKKYGAEIEATIQKQSRLAAMDDEDLQDAFTNLVRSTGSASKGMKLLGVASDVARAKGLDVAKASELVGKVFNGNVGALKRYGIAFDPVTTAQDKLKATVKNATEAQKDAAKAADKQATATSGLALLQKRFAGQAEAYGKSNAGAADRFNVAVENLKEKLGAKLLPAMSSVARAGTRFVEQMESGTGAGGRFAAIVGTVAGTVSGLIGTLKSAVKGFRDGNTSMVVLGGTMASLVAGFVAFKIVTTVIAAMTALKAAVIGVNIAMRANPFVAVATVVAALGVALVVAYKKSETFRRIVDGVFTAVKKVVGDAISFILRAFDKYLGGLSSIASAAAKLPLVGNKFKGVADQIDAGREKLRKMADGLDAIGEKKVKPRIDTSEIDAAIKRAGGLKGALKDSAVRLTATPRKDAGDLPAGSNPGGLLGGLSAGARGVYGSVSRLFGGVRMTSGYRSPAHNRAVGGAPNSDHLTGNALDLVPAEGWNAKSVARFDRIAAWAKRRGLFVGWRGLANHGPGHHLHLSYRGRQTALGQRNEVGDLGVAGLKKLALGQGLSENAASTAAAVGMAESGGNPRASNRNANGTIDRGLWQINSVHGSRSTFDVGGNARAMAAISRKGSNWKPWVAYTSGAYKKFLGAAKKVKPKGRRTSKMGGQSIVPLSDYYQAIQDAKAERQGYQPTGGADAGGGGAATGDPQLDRWNAELAVAGLTKDTADDSVALNALEQVLIGRMSDARAAGDYQGVADFAGSLKGVRDQIEGLKEAVANNTEAQLEQAQALNALKDQAIAESKQRERLSQSQYGTLSNAIADVVNGNLGGRIGLGFQSVGFAGSGARY